MAQPPSFYGDGPHVGRLPAPINPAAPLAEGVNALARAVGNADETSRATDNRVRDVTYQRDLQLRSGEAAAAIATEQGNLAADLIALRSTAGPGAADHEDKVNERIGKFRDTVTETLGGDPDLVGRFVDNIASIAATARTGELEWVATKRAVQSVTDAEGLQNSLSGNIRSAVASGTFSDKMMADADALDARAIQALPIDGTTQAKMIRERRLERIATRADATIDVDPHGVIAAIDKGAYAELDDKIVGRLRGAAEVAAAKLDNAIEQKANASSAVARAEAGNLVEDVNKAVHVDQARLQSYYDQVSGSDKPEDIRLTHDLKIALAKNGVTAAYDNSTQGQRLAAMHEIEGTKGWQADQQLVASHDQLQALIGRDEHEATADPLSLYARQTSQELPALNLSDPAAMARRFTLGDEAGKRYNKPPAYLTEAEATELKHQWNSGTPAAKTQMVAQLAAFGPDRSRAMMRQLAPDRPQIARLVELASYRDPAIKGLVGEALDGSAQPARDGLQSRIAAEARRGFGSALARLPGDRAAALTTVATWIYAHRSAADAKSGTFDKDLALASFQAALGGAGGKGGVGRAGNGEAMVLPTGVAQRDFDAVIASASSGELLRAANGGAYWNGNRAMSEAEFRQLTPVLVRDDGTVTRYAFRSKGGSGFVKTQRGDDFLLDFRQLLPIVKASDTLAAHGYVRR